MAACSSRQKSTWPAYRGKLGWAFIEGPIGPLIRLDDKKQTTMPGVFAAGDAATPMHNATLATAAGVLAGVAAHHSLIGV